MTRVRIGWLCWVVTLALRFAWPHSINAAFASGVLFGVYLLTAFKWRWGR